MIPLFPSAVGSRKLHEDDRQVVWDLTIEPGQRMPPHEHMFDYSFHVLSPSTLAVFNGTDASLMFTFDTLLGETKAFVRRGTQMHDLAKNLPPFDAIHGVQNVGTQTYREILVESKPCASAAATPPVRRIMLFRGAKNHAPTNKWRDRSPQKMIDKMYEEYSLLWGTQANHGSEKHFAGGTTHVVSVLFEDMAHRDRAEVNPKPGVNRRYNEFMYQTRAMLLVDQPAVHFDYQPNVVLARPEESFFSSPPLRHVVLFKFKADAPVGELVAGYSALPQSIPEMKAFEWGAVENAMRHQDLAGGFEFAFMTTFEHAAARDAYLAHEAHEAFAAHVFQYVEEAMIVDFVEKLWW